MIQSLSRDIWNFEDRRNPCSLLSKSFLLSRWAYFSLVCICAAVIASSADSTYIGDFLGGKILWCFTRGMFEYLPTSGASENFVNLFDSFFQLVSRGHINLMKGLISTTFTVAHYKHTTFVMQTQTGTFSARDIARCSFDMPIIPAFAPTMSTTQEGAPEVRPYNVVLR